jgi:hypothetical protein
MLSVYCKTLASFFQKILYDLSSINEQIKYLTKFIENNDVEESKINNSQLNLINFHNQIGDLIKIIV